MIATIPSYGNRKGFIPRDINDYGDGGAYPEIHITQYPLNMGDKSKGDGGEMIPLSVDAEGNLQYDHILNHGRRKDEVVYSKYSDLLPKDMNPEELRKPTAEEEEATAERTRKALGLLIGEKVASVQHKIAPNSTSNQPVVVRYAPSQDSTTGAKERIIRVQEKQKDPLEPSKFRHKKLPSVYFDEAVPITHSPQRKLTKEDQANWKIPPCVSNWKNLKGYTISLDKRMAADGRGLHQVQVNSAFAKFSEALYQAEQTARDEIETRQELQQKLARQKKLAKEEELRQMAAKARMEAMQTSNGNSSRKRTSRHSNDNDSDSDDSDSSDSDDSSKDKEKGISREEREEIRRDRRRMIRRDLRMEHMSEERKKAKRARFAEERDISEQVALGKQPKLSKDGMFDQRLFNREEGLTNNMVQSEDSYNVYDKPLFNGSSANQIYRPKVDTNDDNSTQASTRGRGPVQFEKDETDPFGMGEFLTSAKHGLKKKKKDK